MKNFFVNHTEKVIFGFFVLGFLLMVWGGFSLQPLSITPSELEASVKQGRQKLEDSQPDVSQYTSIDYVSEAGLSSKAISPKALALLKMNNDFRHPIAQPQVKRTQPPVLSVTSLQASSGVGFCPNIQNDSMTSSRTGQSSRKPQLNLTPGVRWVVVTALIPNLEQEKRFFETFQNSDVKYPDSDRPSYYSYSVEREEIDSSGSQGWKPLDVREAILINEKYSDGGNEIVDQEFRTETPTAISLSAKAGQNSLPTPVSMAMPLMNVTKHQWGADCVHLPEIPISAVANRNEETMEDEEGVATSADVIERESPAQTIPTYKLFRFFDTKVEGGKKYRYRVKLILKNPNYNVKPEYVESESITVSPFIEGDWSQPSPVAEVPLDTRLFCVGARTERTAQSSPKLDDFAGPVGQLLVLKFDAVKGLEISKSLNKENVLPGMILNFYNTDFNIQSDSFQDSSNGADFVTNNVVLDYSNKMKPAGSLFKGLPAQPVRALLMSKDGKVFVLSEENDKSMVYSKSNKPSVKASTSGFDRGGAIDDDRGGGRQNPRKNSRQPVDDHTSGGII